MHALLQGCASLAHHSISLHAPQIFGADRGERIALRRSIGIVRVAWLGRPGYRALDDPELIAVQNERYVAEWRPIAIRQFRHLL